MILNHFPFEAIRQIQLEKGNGDVIFIHTTLLPYLNTSKKLKLNLHKIVSNIDEFRYNP